MKISTKGRYALRMVIDLAEHADDGFISLKDIGRPPGSLKKIFRADRSTLKQDRNALHHPRLPGRLQTRKISVGAPSVRSYRPLKAASPRFPASSTLKPLRALLRLRHTPGLGRPKPRHHGLLRRNHDPDDPRPKAWAGGKAQTGSWGDLKQCEGSVSVIKSAALWLFYIVFYMSKQKASQKNCLKAVSYEAFSVPVQRHRPLQIYILGTAAWHPHIFHFRPTTGQRSHISLRSDRCPVFVR